jgi:hypothetical protein
MIFETSFDRSHKEGIAFDLVEFPIWMQLLYKMEQNI